MIYCIRHKQASHPTILMRTDISLSLLLTNHANQNNAFANAMHKFGYDGIQPSDIDETGKQIREEMAQTDPEKAAALSHTELRLLAIRRQMESIRLLRSLEDVAKDWATTVSDLTPVVVENCKT